MKTRNDAVKMNYDKELQDLIQEAYYAANAAEHTEHLAWAPIEQGVESEALYEAARRASRLVGETAAQLAALRTLQHQSRKIKKG